MSLTQFQTDNKALSLMQNSWATSIEPVLSCPIVQGLMLSQVNVVSGDNVINHKLGRKLIGWFVIGSSAFVQLFDKQSTNQNSQLTLILNSNGSATLNLWVF